MRRLLLILLLLPFIALFGCDSNYVLQADTIPETVIVTQEVTVEKIVEVEDTDKVTELEKQLQSKDIEIQQYQDLIGNLNELLSCVYYGYASNDNWIFDGFTAFSIVYVGKYYLITAGHCVENEYGIMDNFKFRANFSNEWIYPKLLKYENNPDNWNTDYAIFSDENIDKGFEMDIEKDEPRYILGCIDIDINVIKPFNIETQKGESGSPIIDHEGEIIGVATANNTYYTDVRELMN